MDTRMVYVKLGIYLRVSILCFMFWGLLNIVGLSDICETVQFRCQFREILTFEIIILKYLFIIM